MSATLSMRPGRVLASGEVLNTYVVELVPSGGQIHASTNHSSRGNWGATESGAYAPGQDVWLGVPSDSTLSDAVILCARAVHNADWVTDAAPSLTVGHPDQVGYEYGSRLVGGGRRAGAMGFAVCKSSDWAPRDALSGEWSQTTPYGSGVGVELFRAWLRGGHMSGVICNSVDMSTRVYGHHLQTWSVAQETDETHEGNTTLAIKRSSLYTDKVVKNKPPERVEISGGLYGGWHSFVYGAEVEGKQANLSHVFQGSNGTLLFRSATQIALIRCGSMAFPAELRRRSDRDAVISAAAVVTPPLLPDAATINLLVEDPRSGLAASESETDFDGMNGLSYMERIQAEIWKSFNGFRGVDESGRGRWMLTSGAATGSSGIEGVSDFSSRMWSSRSIFALPVGEREAAQSAANGTAGIIVDRNGDVVIRGSFGEQILLSRGTISFSAPNDILNLPGRTAFTLAGKHAVVRANEHVELESNTGRVSAKAATQLSLAGDGVLVEALSSAFAATLGDGFDQHVQGLVMLSRGTAVVAAPDVRLLGHAAHAGDSSPAVDTFITIDARKVQLRSESAVATLEKEFIVAIDGSAGVPLVVGAGYSVLPAIFTDQTPCVELSPNDQHIVTAISAAAVADNSYGLQTLPDGLLPVNFFNFSFQWGTSEQYGTDTEEGFKLYEQPWQRLYRAESAPVPSRWVQSFTLRGDTCAYPGTAAWIDETRFVALSYTDWYSPDSMAYDSGLNSVNGVDTNDATVLPPTEVGRINNTWIIRP